MISKLKFIIYELVLQLATRKRKIKQKTVLIVKTDEIGDYILWRNFAYCFKDADRYKGYHFIFCGNSAFRKVTESFDPGIFDSYIWLNKGRFKSDMRYRFQFLRQINKLAPEILINPIYSRSPRVDDAIVKAADANINTGMAADRTNFEKNNTDYSKGIYHKIISIDGNNIFEFLRNKTFAEKVTGSSLSHIKMEFDKQLLKKPDELPDNYFIVFPGSSVATRKWDIENFISVAKFIKSNYNYDIVVCGGPADMQYVQAFLEKLDQPCVFFKEKNGLKDFINALAYAKLLISVDTGAVHLAAAVNCPVYGIFNGSFYGRFAPYPDELNKKFYAIYPDEVDKEINPALPVPSKYQYITHTNYNDVSAEKVISKIQETLAKGQ